MKVSLLILTLLGGLAPQIPLVSASHGQVAVTIVVHRGYTVVATYEGTAPSCDGNTCHVDVMMNNRDLNRFERWCSSNPLSLTILDGSALAFASCSGNGGGWGISVVAELAGVSLASIHTGSDVAVEIQAHPA